MLERDLIFNGLGSWPWAVFWLLTVLGAAALIVMLMRYERRLVPRKVGYTLMLLRFAVLALLLLTLLEPVMSWTLDREQTGRIIVAVDLSESMSTADKHADKAEKLRWARALGMIGNPGIDARLDRWAEAFAKDEEPPWVDPGETQDPVRREQIAQARRENLEGIFEELDRIPRREIALRLLTATSAPLLPQLQEIGQVEVIGFAGQTAAAEEGTLEALVTTPPIRIQSDITDLTQAVSGSAADQADAPILGVVLFSDGRDTAGRDANAAAARLGQQGAPVCPVLLGSEHRPRDLAIAALDYPQTSFKDDTPQLKATLNTSGFEDQEITVLLEQEGEEPISRTVRAEGNRAEVEFDLDAETVGRRQYTIRTEVQTGETREDNNQKSFAMNVVDDKVHVLLLEGEARWEFRFIDAALTRDENVELREVVYNQPYMGILQDTFFPRTLPLPAVADDLQQSPFSEPDLIILGDVASSDLPPVGWELLQKFVSEAGGTLVMIAGKNHFPLGYRSPIVDELVPMTDLQPLNITGPAALGSPTERGFHLKLTPEGEQETMLQFDADPVENRSIWSGLPGHLWGLVGEAKPGASVLAYAVQPGQEVNLENERRQAIIVHQHYGFGQVLWLGIDSTWRWRHRVGDTWHHRFWGQLGRWAAENKAAAGNEFVKFGPDRGDIELGEDAVLRARWTQRFLRQNPDLKARAIITRGDAKPGSKPFSTLELNPVDTRPLLHEARLVSLPPGEYRITLEVDGANLGPDEVTAMLYVHDRQTVELSDLSSNRDLLTQIAESGGGRLFLPDEMAQIPPMFLDPELTEQLREETVLWDQWYMVLLFFALMTTEWVVRKLNGLP